MHRLLVYILKSPGGIQEEAPANCYYSLRDDIKPANGIVKAARFITINKTCFDCLYIELIRKANLMGTLNYYRRSIYSLSTYSFPWSSLNKDKYDRDSTFYDPTRRSRNLTKV